MSSLSIIASGAFSNNSKTEPSAVQALKSAVQPIDIPALSRAALAQANNISPPLTPPLLSTSASSSDDGFESLDIMATKAARRRSQEFFFPNQTQFECIVPVVTSARSVVLKDHPIVEGEFAEYDRLYNDDSLMTVDGRPMVRLL